MDSSKSSEISYGCTIQSTVTILPEELKQIHEDGSLLIIGTFANSKSSSSSSLDINLSSSERIIDEYNENVIEISGNLSINRLNDMDMQFLSLETRREHAEKVQAKVQEKKINAANFLLMLPIISLMVFFILGLSISARSESDASEIFPSDPSITKLCSPWETLEIKNICSSDQDFCAKFSTNSLSAQEKVDLLIHEYHWNLNENGNSVKVKAIDQIDNCKKFVALSSDGIRIWTWYSNRPDYYELKDAEYYALSHNNKFVVYSNPAGAMYKLDINEKVTTRVSFLFSEVPVSGIIISDDDTNIMAIYQELYTIQVFDSRTLDKRQRFIDIEGDIRKVAVEGVKNDVIVLDAKGIKIYFMEANRPAILIHNLTELKKWKKSYFKLTEFENALRTRSL